MQYTANTILNKEEILSLISHTFLHELPFNTLFQYEIGHQSHDQIELKFNRRDELIGNKMQNILHGGVISSALDTVGGLIAAHSLFYDTKECTFAQFTERFSKLGTIHLNINYLRPGKGSRFTASAQTQRRGNKIAVYALSFRNEHNTYIASGIGSYLVS